MLIQMIKTAILIDGGFLIKRLPRIVDENERIELENPQKAAEKIIRIAIKHIRFNRSTENSHYPSEKNSESCIDDPQEYLYRILYYDCPPLTKKVHLPVSNRCIDFGKTEQAQFRIKLHEALRSQRKVALRLGHLSEHTSGWILKPRVQKQLMSNQIELQNLTDNDFYYDTKQKGVDIKIGIDIASLTLKKLVDKIVLISGDADFIPAAKLARREGIDVLLDPLGNKINKNLNEHVDGIQSTYLIQ